MIFTSMSRTRTQEQVRGRRSFGAVRLAQRPQTEARRGRSRAGEDGMHLMLLADAIGAFPPSGLKDSTVYPAFFIAPAMKPRTVCFCHAILSMISASVAPFFRWSMATTWAVLLPSRGPAVSCALAAFLALGAFLAEVAFLVALALAGAPLAACAPPLAFLRPSASRLRFGLRGLAEALDVLPDAADGGLGALEASSPARRPAGCSRWLPGARPARRRPVPPVPSGWRRYRTGWWLRRRPPRGCRTR